MQVLVTAASKHGSTADIARAIGDGLTAEGMQVTVAEPDKVTDLTGYDAVVLGSAVYAGHWLDPAKRLVERLPHQLARHPVWLFSSGPVGDPPVPKEDAVEIGGIVETTAAREHRAFAGNIDKSKLGFGEGAIVRALRVPVGDYRDWDEIRAWATDIARALRRETATM